MPVSNDTWTIKAALDWTVGYLERKGDENPRLSAEWLLAEATRLRRIELYVNFDRPLSMEERDILRDFVRRRGAGEPLQYITGEVAFRHIAVKVRPGVLIPRPETEVLVSEALALLPAPEKRCAVDSLSREELEQLFAESDEDEAPARVRRGLLVCDMCTGSGCIACSVAYEHPCTRVVATDISATAVALARENACALGLDSRVDVIECDLASGIPAQYEGRFDLVVSNPPYIPDAVMEVLPREVSDYEPELALAGGNDGLDIFRRMLPEMRRLLRSGGAFACELHEDCLDAAAQLAEEAGYVDCSVKFDLTGRPRVLVARKA